MISTKQKETQHRTTRKNIFQRIFAYHSARVSGAQHPSRKRRSAGFTLVEMLVAMTVFLTVLGVGVGSFIFSFSAQRTVLTEKEVSETVNFALEFMSRKMRVAQIYDPDSPDCGGLSHGESFETDDGTQVRFVDSSDNCVEFRYNDAENIIEFDNGTSTKNLTEKQSARITGLEFSLQGNTNTDGEQPRVTININAQGVGKSEEAQGVTAEVQTTVSVREINVE